MYEIDRSDTDYRQNDGNLPITAVQWAENLAQELHAGILRTDGTAYLEHIFQVREILESWQAPPEVLAAGLLHDALKKERSHNPSISIVRKVLGDQVANIVQVVTDLSKYDTTQNLENLDETTFHLSYIEDNFPWILLTIQNVPEAAIIRFAARLEKLRNWTLPIGEWRKKYLYDTLNIYVPLANRLGMWAVKRELEDLAFRLLINDVYLEFSKNFPDGTSVMMPFVEELNTCLKNYGFENTSVNYEPISYYSVYLNQEKKITQNISSLLFPVQVKVSDKESCYRAIEPIHNLWKPVIGQFRDYIATPKFNNYQGLRTKVQTPSGKVLTILIRDEVMNKIADWGIAAKWWGVPKMYIPTPIYRQPQEGKITVFTPEGESKDLKVGSTPVDFAYAIHREVGHRCTDAIVNGNKVPLSYQLNPGDIVRILYGSISEPAKEWLDFVITDYAKAKIREWHNKNLRQQKISDAFGFLQKELSETSGVITLSTERLEKIAKALGYKQPYVEKLLLSLYDKKLDIALVIKKLQIENQKPNQNLVQSNPSQAAVVVIQGYSEANVSLAHCCKPSPPDRIVGYLTQSGVISVHKVTCGNIRRRKTLIDVEWERVTKTQLIEIQVAAKDRLGLVEDVSRVFVDNEINMVSFHADSIEDGSARILIGISAIESRQLDKLIKKIRKLPNVSIVTTGIPQLPNRFASKAVIERFLQNPYTLNPVQGSQFFGRDQELRELIENLRQWKSNGAVLLWGARRIGKTSLLREFCRRFARSQNYIPVYLNLEGICGLPLSNFFYEIEKEIQGSVQNPRIVASAINRIRREPLAYFHNFMKSVSSLDSRKIILVFDEFQLFNRINIDPTSLRDTIYFLRSLVQSGKLGFIFSGAGHWQTLLAGSNNHLSALLNVSHLQEIDCLTKQDAEKLITEPLTNIVYEESTVQQLLDLTASHPYYIQCICQELVSIAHEQNLASIQSKSLDYLLSQWLPRQPPSHFDQLWGNQSGIDENQERKNKLVLVTLALQMESADHFITANDLLQAKISNFLSLEEIEEVFEYLYRIGSVKRNVNGEYAVKIELARLWLRSNYTYNTAIKEIID